MCNKNKLVIFAEVLISEGYLYAQGNEKAPKGFIKEALKSYKPGANIVLSKKKGNQGKPEKCI